MKVAVISFMDQALDVDLNNQLCHESCLKLVKAGVFLKQVDK